MLAHYFLLEFCISLQHHAKCSTIKQILICLVYLSDINVTIAGDPGSDISDETLGLNNDISVVVLCGSSEEENIGVDMTE